MSILQEEHREFWFCGIDRFWNRFYGFASKICDFLVFSSLHFTVSLAFHIRNSVLNQNLEKRLFTLSKKKIYVLLQLWVLRLFFAVPLFFY